MSLEDDPEILDIAIIAVYTDGSRELKTSIQDAEVLVDLLVDVAEEVQDEGLDEFNFTLH